MKEANNNDSEYVFSNNLLGIGRNYYRRIDK